MNRKVMFNKAYTYSELSLSFGVRGREDTPYSLSSQQRRILKILPCTPLIVETAKPILKVLE